MQLLIEAIMMSHVDVVLCHNVFKSVFVSAYLLVLRVW
jgi:hypothetical protein